MKVRQAIPVTSELGDTGKLAHFDGECPRPDPLWWGSPGVWSTLGTPGPSTWCCGPLA